MFLGRLLKGSTFDVVTFCVLSVICKEKLLTKCNNILLLLQPFRAPDQIVISKKFVRQKHRLFSSKMSPVTENSEKWLYL